MKQLVLCSAALLAFVTLAMATTAYSWHSPEAFGDQGKLALNAAAPEQTIYNWHSPEAPGGKNKLQLTGGPTPATVKIPSAAKIAVYEFDEDEDKYVKMDPQPEFTIDPPKGSEPSASIDINFRHSPPQNAKVVISEVYSSGERANGGWI